MNVDEFRRIDDVDGDAARLGLLEDSRIDEALAARRVGEALAVEVARQELAGHDPDGALRAQLGDLG